MGLACNRPSDDPIVLDEPQEQPAGVDPRISYEILVYSFADSDGDRIGDFNGIASHLDYLESLGVTAVWLSPIFPASSYHGYDITDFYTVNPKYGTEADFRSLVTKAHAKGIRVYLDFVLNHTSKYHPWFTEALANKDSKYRDYYFIYADGSYKCVFGEWMPDLNYGAAGSCESHPAFQEVCAAADKWIGMGVDGFRLDAVKHIYDNATNADNPTFLRKFYDHCNKTYKAAGHEDDIYMVGEHFSEASEVSPYYAGLPALFEFSFWWRLVECINSGSGKDFAPTIVGYHKKYAGVRTDAIAATKLTNHDEDRAAETLGKDLGKTRIAAAVLLTSDGQPYIYQGEELGYWGMTAGGDEYVRTPIIWSSSASGLADYYTRSKTASGMLVSERSVEKQSLDGTSLLATYKAFGKARAEYPALSIGDMVPRSVSNAAIGAWYRNYENQKILVLHNFSSENQTLSFMQDKLSNEICHSGSVTVDKNLVTLGAWSSACFLQ